MKFTKRLDQARNEQEIDAIMTEVLSAYKKGLLHWQRYKGIEYFATRRKLQCKETFTR